MEISAQPFDNKQNTNNSYFIQLYFEDFDFVSVTYNGKVKDKRSMLFERNIFKKRVTFVYNNCIYMYILWGDKDWLGCYCFKETCL